MSATRLFNFSVTLQNTMGTSYQAVDPIRFVKNPPR